MKRFVSGFLALLLATALLLNAVPARAEIIEWAHTPVQSAQGTTDILRDTSAQHNGYDFLIYKPTKIGDAITFSLRIDRAGYYKMRTTYYKTGNEGIYQWEINGHESGEKDLFRSDVWEHGTFYVDSGVYTITYRCIGQNPRSPSLGVYLGNLDLKYYSEMPANP